MKTYAYRRKQTAGWRRFQGFLLMVLVLGGIALQFAPNRTAQAQPQEPLCTRPHTNVATPLTDLGNREYVRMDGERTGMTGGLYPNGSNVRPPAHEAAAVAMAAQVRPLAPDGRPDAANGKIGFISIGMSNTSMEFRVFIGQTFRDPTLNPKLEITNGAIGGRTSRHWADPNNDAWQIVNDRLAHEGLTPAQVQVAWIKLTQTGHGEFPDKPQALEAELRIIVRNLKDKFPNVKIAYMSSRTRSYLTWNGLSPEPDAYETGFAVKWLIAGQIAGDVDLNYDPARGPVEAPILVWGPYVWIDGENRRADGQVWLASDLRDDCVHPSSNGTAKIAGMLLNFFKTDTTATWFRTGGASVLDRFFFLPWIARP